VANAYEDAKRALVTGHPVGKSATDALADVVAKILHEIEYSGRSCSAITWPWTQAMRSARCTRSPPPSPPSDCARSGCARASARTPEALGYTVVDGESVIVTHLTERSASTQRTCSRDRTCASSSIS
jgi:hypothetical protein